MVRTRTMVSGMRSIEAAANQAGTPLQGIADLPFDLIQGCRTHQRADAHPGLQAVAGLHFRNSGPGFRDEIIDDAALNKYPVGADAGLAGVQEFYQHGPLGRINRIDIIKNNEGRMPPELQRDSFHLFGSAPGQQ